MTEEVTAIIDVRGTINAVGDTLTRFLKSGPQYVRHSDDIYARVMISIEPLIPSVQVATANYEQACKGFLDNVIRARGMPSRVTSSVNSESEIVSSSGRRIAEIFDSLLPSIIERFNWSVENYRNQADNFLKDQTAEFRELIMEFLNLVPIGGAKDKALKSYISDIKRNIRYLIQWNRLFSSYKTQSFSAEIDYIFTLQGNPLAAVWRYIDLCGQGEYKVTHDHKDRHGRVYAVRDNWAINKGFMQAGHVGFVDSIDKPGEEIGCMCQFRWLYSIEDLPGDFLTSQGKAEIRRVSAIFSDGFMPDN